MAGREGLRSAGAGVRKADILQEGALCGKSQPTQSGCSGYIQVAPPEMSEQAHKETFVEWFLQDFAVSLGGDDEPDSDESNEDDD